MQKSKLPKLYKKLEAKRQPFLDRGRQYSRMTLPYVLPQSTPTGGDSNNHGYHGIGAEATNHLSNKIVQALFPVNDPFFNMELDLKIEKEMLGKSWDKNKLTLYFNEITRLAMRQMRKLNMRPLLVSYEKHLIITGNASMVFTETGVRQLGLDRYVVKRSPEGKLLQVITCEEVAFVDLPEEVKAVYMARNPTKTGKSLDDTDVKLYTGYFKCDDDTFVGMQSVEDIDVWQEDGIADTDMPIVVGRWNATSGEDYGRGLVEDHSGDFWTISFLSEARARGAAIMMDVKYLVRAGSLTDVDTLNKAPSGEFVLGMEEDISVLQLDKFADSRLITDVMNEYKERIGRAFLMLQSSIRDSERTTKYEIQKLANELDLSMGGVYSSQAEELQQPLAVQLIKFIDSRLINKELTPVINTGLEALGRANELEKILQFSELMMLPQNWPETLQQDFDWKAYSTAVASSLSLSIDGFFLNRQVKEDAVKQEQEGQTTSVMADAVASSLGSQIGKKLGE